MRADQQTWPCSVAPILGPQIPRGIHSRIDPERLQPTSYLTVYVTHWRRQKRSPRCVRVLRKRGEFTAPCHHFFREICRLVFLHLFPTARATALARLRE